MISVYILHVQSFLGDINLWISPLLHPFYVNAFFVVSGFLFFRKWIGNSSSVKPGKKDFSNILFRLVIPTMLFSSIIYAPKMLFHSLNLELSQYFYDVFGGVSFWFTSAITISQVVLLLALASNITRLYGFVLLSVLIVVAMPFIRDAFPLAFPWYWKSGLVAVVFMTLGGLIYQYKAVIKKYLTLSLVLSSLAYAATVIYGAETGGLRYAAMSASFNVSGFFATLSAISFISIISYKWIPSVKLLQFIGNNSIIFYFLSGAIPAAVSSYAVISGLADSFNLLIVSAMSIALGAVCTWIIVKYLPFLTDLRTIKRLK